MASASELALLLRILDRAFDHASWHGVTLRGSLRRVTAAQAAWRPHASRHNVWETVLHCAYWKYAVWRRLTGAPRGSFPLGGSNWWSRPDGPATERAWREDRALLDRTHVALRDAVARTPPASLDRRSRTLKTTPFDLISGIAAHDLYHAGQIQLLKVLYRKRRRA